ncbi:M16 family metallopeptidase [Streptomyces sp. NPDC059445]|uniref:M16 family metallopeptidase n=1 Tax=Streptomyces sp. NPDC059445 TaxID=3346832 RepID=UPI0036BA7091
MQLVLVPLREARTVCLTTTWRCGFVDDPMNMPGMAHLMEHLVFQGTERYSREAYYRNYLGVGGSTNASTRTEHTSFCAEFPSVLLPTAMAMEADRFTAIAPSAERIAHESRIIRQEIGSTLGARPFGAFPWAEVQNALFDNYAYRHNGYVSCQWMADVSTADCVTFLQKNYRPEQAAVCLVGQFDPAHVLDLAERTFGQIERSALPAVRALPVPVRTPTTIVSEHRGAPCCATSLAWRVPELSDARRGAGVIGLVGALNRTGARDLREKSGHAVHLYQVDYGMFQDMFALTTGAYLLVQLYHACGQGRDLAASVQSELHRLGREPLAGNVITDSAATVIQGIDRRCTEPPLLSRILAEQAAIHGSPWHLLQVRDSLTQLSGEQVALKAAELAARTPAVVHACSTGSRTCP